MKYRRYYRGIYIPSVTYSFAVNMISRRLLDPVTKAGNRPFLAKVGFARNTPLGVVFGARKYGGLGLHDLWVYQGTEQVYTFLKHWRANSTAGNLSRIALSWAQHNSGSSFPLLEHPFQKMAYLENPWFTSVREFLKAARCHITVDEPSIYPAQRVGDRHLMDIFRESSLQFSTADLRKLNYCRLHLNVTVISDICDASGRYILPGVVEGDISTAVSTSRDQPAHQPRPECSATWRLWKRALRTLIRPGPQQRGKPWRLLSGLGPWNFSHEKLRRQWQAYFSEAMNSVYLLDVANSDFGVHPREPTSNLFVLECTSRVTFSEFIYVSLNNYRCLKPS